MIKRVNETIEKLTEKNIESILCTEDASRRKQPWVYRWIAKVAAICGTVAFLLWNAAIFTGWVAFNELVYAFDPYPFTFLLFGVSLEAIFLSVLILISQNLAAEESERRHHLDLQINLLSEREMTALMRLTLEMAARAGVAEDKLDEVRGFAHDTDPSGVLGQIVSAERRHHLQPPGEPQEDSNDPRATLS